MDTSDRTREEVEEMPGRAAEPADADLARLTRRQQSVLALMAYGPEQCGDRRGALSCAHLVNDAATNRSPDAATEPTSC